MEKEKPTVFYLYRMDPKCGAAAVGRGGEILVLEQNGKTEKGETDSFQDRNGPGAEFSPDTENGLKDLPKLVKIGWLDLKGKGLGGFEKVEDGPGQ